MTTTVPLWYVKSSLSNGFDKSTSCKLLLMMYCVVLYCRMMYLYYCAMLYCNALCCVVLIMFCVVAFIVLY